MENIELKQGDVQNITIRTAAGDRVFACQRIEMAGQHAYLMAGKRSGQYVASPVPGGTYSISSLKPVWNNHNLFSGAVLREIEGKLVVERHPGDRKSVRV